VFFRDGHQIKNYQAAWHTACKKAGLIGKFLHDTRRTTVRNMIRAGIPDTVAMKISGHKTRSVFDRYNIISEDDLREAAKKISQAAKEKKDSVERIKKAYHNFSTMTENEKSGVVCLKRCC
jgi:integrase